MSYRALFAVVAASLVGGCLSVTPPEGRLVCTEATVAEDCPSGWSCNEGYCYRDAVDAGPTDSGIECTDVSQCDDGNTCTTDACANTQCSHTFVVTADPDAPDDTGTDSNCDGFDGVATKDLYVRVGASGVGTGADPASFAGALAAFDGTQQIFVAAGDYATDAPLVVPSGASIQGGYANDFRSRPGGSRVVSSANRALVVDGASGVSIDSVDFETADATVPGGHTETVTILDSTVVLRRLRVVAGDALAGGAGSTGMAGTPPAAAGPNGDNGNGTAGGAGASCGSPGGQGGGTNGPAVKGSGTAPGTGCGEGGGPGGSTNDHRSCDGNITYTGATGMPGQDGCVQSQGGSLGSGGSGLGSIALDGSWVGVAAGPGGDGPDGSPGGGGGGGPSYNRDGTGCFSATPTRGGGAGGGCGGVGGDGGRGGGAGQAGGASIAIVARGSVVTLDTVMVVAGNGGAGGAGGDGGPGAAGVPGSGGGTGGTVQGSNFNFFRGGSGGGGGTGSTGGGGGCGGGGAGGSSVGVLLVGVVTLDDSSATYTLGSAGAGGLRCPSAGNDPGLGTEGTAGVAQNVAGPI